MHNTISIIQEPAYVKLELLRDICDFVSYMNRHNSFVDETYVYFSLLLDLASCSGKKRYWKRPLAVACSVDEDLFQK